MVKLQMQKKVGDTWYRFSDLKAHLGLTWPTYDLEMCIIQCYNVYLPLKFAVPVVQRAEPKVIGGVMQIAPLI